MTTQNSRKLLDTIRSYASDVLTAEGAVEDIPNVGVPFVNDNRVQTAIDWVLTREAEVKAQWTPAMDAAWEATQIEIWAGLDAALDAAGVRQHFVDVWNDSDAKARILLRALTRLLSRLMCFHRFKV